MKNSNINNKPRQFTLSGANLENIKVTGQGSEVLLENDFITDFIRKYINFAIRVFNDDTIDTLDRDINIDRLMTISDTMMEDILPDYISTNSEAKMTYKSDDTELSLSAPDRQACREIRESQRDQPFKTLIDYIELIRSISHDMDDMELFFFLKEKISGSVKGELILYCGCEDNIPSQYMGWNVESFSLERVNVKSTEAIKVEMKIIRPDTKEVK